MKIADTKRDAEIVQLAMSGVKTADIAARYGVQSPAITKVLRKHGLLLAPQRGNTKGGRRKAEVQATVVQIIPEPIYRDPCFMCGTRADVGCHHRKAA